METKRVLGLEHSATIDGTDVILDLEDNYKSMSQNWVLVPYFYLEDAEGKEWYMVKNVLSERFLTATDSKNLKIRGKKHYCCFENQFFINSGRFVRIYIL